MTGRSFPDADMCRTSLTIEKTLFAFTVRLITPQQSNDLTVLLTSAGER